MAAQTTERQSIHITCLEGEVDMRVGDAFKFLGHEGVVFEGITGRELKSSDDRKTPVLLISSSALLTDHLPRFKNGPRKDLYEVCGDNVAAAVLRQRAEIPV